MPRSSSRSPASASARYSLGRCTARRGNSTGRSRMVRECSSRLLRAAIMLVLLAPAATALAQIDKMQMIYAGLADNIRKEYQLHVNQAVRQLIVSNAPMGKIEPVKQRLK